jgi:hypothetical protein
MMKKVRRSEIGKQFLDPNTGDMYGCAHSTRWSLDGGYVFRPEKAVVFMIPSGLFWLSLRSFLVGSTGAEKRAEGDETLGKGRRTDRSAKPSGPASSRQRGTLSSVF